MHAHPSQAIREKTRKSRDLAVIAARSSGRPTHLVCLLNHSLRSQISRSHQQETNNIKIANQEISTRA
jgi:hypothetical protein